MAADTAVLVTRPAGQAAPLLEALREAGLAALHQPLLEVSPLAELPPQARRCVLDLDLYQHVIFISANAARFGLDCIDDYWPQLPMGVNWYALGGSTASLLEQRGLRPLTPATSLDSEGLLALPELVHVSGQRVLIVKGEGGRETLARVLGERGARVDQLACYRRACPRLPAGALASILEDAAVGAVLISSGEGLQNMLALLSAEETTKFRDIGLVVPSPRVAALASEAGFSRVVTAENASDAAMLDALLQWRAGD